MRCGETIRGGLLVLALSACAFPAGAEEPAAEPALNQRAGHAIAAWIPNRILDVFDIVRLRVRLGPGGALGMRFTRPLSGSVGAYSAFYLGLPGPRGEPTVLSPIGLEHLGKIDPPSLHASREPYYGVGEIGLGAQLGFVGFDVGVDPAEALDFALGVVFVDLLKDDF
jgi:hypothetical protein